MLDSNSSCARLLTALPLMVALTLLNGCASIFTGTTDKVTFDSNVPGVRVTIDGEYKGETPVTLTLSRNFMNGPEFKAKFEKAGYQTQEFQLKHEFNTVAVLDITSIPTSGGIDLLTGALMKFSPTEYHVQMRKHGVADAERSLRLYRYALVNYRNVQMDISRGGGEYLDSLASALSGAQGPADAAITEQALRNAPALLGTTDAHEFVRRLNGVLASQPELSAYQI